VTIDFGDGRKLTRTVTGNSIHYVLDAEGRVVDGLPGLYGPKRFMQWLVAMNDLVTESSKLDERAVRRERLAYHRGRAGYIKQDWANDLEKVAPGVDLELERADTPEPPPSRPATSSRTRATPAHEVAVRQQTQQQAVPQQQAAPPPPQNPPAENSANGRQAVGADRASRAAVGKTAVEAPILRAINLDPAKLDRATNEEFWKKIAALHAEDARLDARSVEVIRRENPPTAVAAGRLAITKGRVEDPILRLVRQFESSIALDAVRNEYLLHRRIHEWFVAGDTTTANVDALNERVYAELFLTPSSDPWLGLAPADTYSALEGNGVATDSKPK
jgi:hypothetical protein